MRSQGSFRLRPSWVEGYGRPLLRADLAAGLTVGAMLVPQAMAYALLAGLPPQVGLYAATFPLLAYALLGTSRQLAVGPVAIVSLMTAAALAPIAEEGTGAYLAAAAVLALLVGFVHLVMGFGRLGFLVNVLSHSVLVGFTAAAAIIIGFSQVKHLLGISVPRSEHFYETVLAVAESAGDANAATVGLGLVSLAILLGLKRYAPRVPGALIVVAGSILLVNVASLSGRGVKTVGTIPDSLPTLALPAISTSQIGDLWVTAIVITVVGFMESIAVAKVYARRHRYEVKADRELVSLGLANITSGLFGGYPVTGGFSRTAVNDTAGAKTPFASVVTAAVVVVTIIFFTPAFASLPNAALGAIIIAAVIGLIDVAEMRHIAKVKRSDLVGMVTAFVATLVLGIELGILVAVVASMLVVFARMSKPHSAVLGHVAGTTSYRNVDRFDEAHTIDGVRIVRIDAAVSFANAAFVKDLLNQHAGSLLALPDGRARALILDASGINDVDATGADMLNEVLQSIESRGLPVHLCSAKGPVRDVLHRAGTWVQLEGRIHASVHDAVEVVEQNRPGPTALRSSGVDERGEMCSEKMQRLEMTHLKRHDEHVIGQL